MKPHILMMIWMALAPLKVEAKSWFFRNIDVKNGLSDNFVRDIAIDSEGFVWFSTINGLSRYDGYRFLNYQPQQAGAQSGDVAQVRETADSTLWMVCSGVLFTYSRATQSWQRRESDVGPLTAFYVDDAGDLWLAGSQGISHRDYSLGRTFRIDCRDVGPILHIVGRNGMTLVVTADYKIYKVMTGDAAAHLSFVTQHPKPGTDNRDSRVLLDSHRNLWIYHAHELAGMQWLCSLDSRRWRQAVELRQMGSDVTVNVMGEDHDGNLWVGTGNRGVCIFTPQLQPASLHLSPFKTLSSHITCMFADRNNTMWMGSAKLGAAYADLDSPDFIQVATDGLEDVSTLMEDSEGRLWIGFDGAGVTCQATDGKAAVHYSAQQGQLPSDIITSLAIDGHGDILAGSYGDGMARFDGQRFIPLYPDYTPLRYIKAMTTDKHGTLWVATVDKGVVRIAANGRMTNYTSANSPLPSNGTLCLGYDATLDRIYIGTSTGIAAFDCGHEGFVTPKDFELLKGTYVTSLLVGSNRELWVGSRNGLWVYCADRWAGFIHLTTQQGLSHTVVRALAASNGNVWVSTDNGLTRVTTYPRIPSPPNGDLPFALTPYYAANGLHDIVFSNNAALTTQSGTVLLGCFTGYVSIPLEFPSAFRRLSSPLRVRFTEIRVNGELEERPAEGFTIRHDERVGISVSIMMPVLSHKARYLYRFKDDEEWMGTPGNTFNFASLKPGSYELQVKAELPGQVTTDVSELHFKVLPPFWLSTPALLLYTLLAVAMVLLVVRSLKRSSLTPGSLISRGGEGSIYTQGQSLTTPLSLARKATGRRVSGNGAGGEAGSIEIKPSDVTVKSLDEELISHVIARIEENIRDTNYSVAQLSSDVGMTRGHLYKKLMAITGTSPVEFIRTIRIKRGKSLLDQGKTNISEVADMVGFSPKQFAHYFKSLFGDTPTNYLRKHKTGSVS